jgi:hypothetical protein
VSQPTPTNAEIAAAQAMLARRAPLAPAWVAAAIARQRAAKRVQAERATAARARRELIEQARRCNTCRLPLQHVARPDEEACTCRT